MTTTGRFGDTVVSKTIKPSPAAPPLKRNHADLAASSTIPPSSADLEATQLFDSTPPPPEKKQRTCGVPVFSMVKVDPSEQPPRLDIDERELTAEELQTFRDLGYEGELKAFQSKSNANLGRWYIGAKRNEFGCWMDAPVKFGFIKRQDGTLVSKESLSELYYKPWAQDQNTNYFAQEKKKIRDLVAYVEQLVKFLEEADLRILHLESQLDVQMKNADEPTTH